MIFSRRGIDCAHCRRLKKKTPPWLVAYLRFNTHISSLNRVNEGSTMRAIHSSHRKTPVGLKLESKILKKIAKLPFLGAPCIFAARHKEMLFWSSIFNQKSTFSIKFYSFSFSGCVVNWPTQNFNHTWEFPRKFSRWQILCHLIPMVLK